MVNMKRLNYPSIPSTLLNDINIDNLTNTSYKSKYLALNIYTLNSDIKNWIENNILFTHINPPSLFVFSKDSAIHKDSKISSDNTVVYRKHAVNFVIKSGGDNVVTTVYDDEFNPIENNIFHQHEWYYLNTGRYHSVTNITEPRMLISCCPSDDAVFNNILL